MLILLIFSFLAGIVTILSPCILPILPIVLSGSITGGKSRPLGIVTGFILSFTFFTLFLSTIVKATGVSPDALRIVAIVVVFVFGLGLILPQFQILLEKLFSRLASLVPRANTDTGFIGGIFVGLSLGLVWAPCVGPILASVISLSFTGAVTSTSILITLAYSLGTAIPMLAITYGGRNLLTRVPWLLTNSEKIQKGFGVLMIATALAIAFNLDRKFQTYVLAVFPNYGIGLTKIEENDAVKQALNKLSQNDMGDTRGKPMFDVIEDMGTPAPEFIVGGEWINSDPLTMSGLTGKVVLVDFWTYTCINCIRTLPYLKNWHEKYTDKGLVIVGVHTPEFEFEKSLTNVEKATKDFGLTYPIMQDNEYATWRAYANRYWPAKYLVDKNGRVRYTHFGEGEYDETEKMIQKLLAETGTIVDEEINNPTYTVQARTPELYLGYQRISALASPERIIPNKPVEFTAPKTMYPHSFAFTGIWTLGEEYAMPSKGAKLMLNYEAAEVFLVMRPKNGNTGKIKVSSDGKFGGGEDVDFDGSIITVTEDRLYKIVKMNPANLRLIFEFLDDNIELYAFTFG